MADDQYNQGYQDAMEEIQPTLVAIERRLLSSQANIRPVQWMQGNHFMTSAVVDDVEAALKDVQKLMR